MRWIALLNEKLDRSTVTLLSAANRVPACSAHRTFFPNRWRLRLFYELAYFCCNSMHAVRFVCSIEPASGLARWMGFELGKEQIYWSRTWRLMALLDEELRSNSQASKNSEPTRLPRVSRTPADHRFSMDRGSYWIFLPSGPNCLR